MLKIGICLPSYNESENIIKLIQQIFLINVNSVVCVVDDNSPDHTSNIIKKKYSEIMNQKLFLIDRPTKDGRGSAVWEGFKLLNSKFSDLDIYIEMDCDFSHSLEDLEKGINLFQEKKIDVLLGSRYPDGQIRNWPVKRKIFSYCANILIRYLISKDIYDYTNGFRFYNKKAINLILNSKPKNKGFIYLSETLSIFLINNLKIFSFPIVFNNRIRGKSNTNILEAFRSLKGIFKISKDYKKYKK